MSFVRHGVVLPLGKDNDFDDYFVYYSAVLEREGKIWMYYTGHDGSKARIGLAISDDGITFVRQGVVLPLGADGDFDDAALFSPAVLERDGLVWMYYTGQDGNRQRMGLAISDDGVSFIRQGVVLPLGTDGDFDDKFISSPALLERGGKIWMYYSAHDGSYSRVGLAISEDGVNFVRQGMVLPLGAKGDFDDMQIYYPTALERDGRVWLYYTGNENSKPQMGLAISEDGINFVRQGVVLPLGTSGDFDDDQVYYLNALERSGRVWMYYTGYDGAKARIGLAISEDGL